MGRALGINATMLVGYEAVTYGTPPAAAAFKLLPFVSSQMGEERPLIEDDQLGFGREGLDPTYDVATDVGDIVVPMDTLAIGYWLKLLLGQPTSVQVGATTNYHHTFNSGSPLLPSASIEVGLPDVPDFALHYGATLNTFKTSLSRSGMLNATLSMIAQGEQPGTNVSVAPAAGPLRGPRFAQAVGYVNLNDVQIGGIVSADFSYSNGLDPVETIKADGRIEGVDPGRAMLSGTLGIKYASRQYRALAEAGTPVELTFGWTNGTASLMFTVNRAFLPKPKNPVTGPKGVMASYNFQASGGNGPQLTVDLINSRVGY